MGKKLTANQKIFVSEYIVDRNATRAYLESYKSVKKENVAAQSGSALLRNPKVAAAIADALDAQQKRTEITADKTLRECGRIAFSDPRKVFDEAGSLKPVHDFDDDTAAAVSSIEVVCKQAGGGEVEHVHKIRFWDKNAAINNLGKHFKLFIEQLNIGGEVAVNHEGIMERVLKEKARILNPPTDDEKTNG